MQVQPKNITKVSVNLYAALIYSYALIKKVLTFSFNTTVMDIKAPKITRRTLPCILNLYLFVPCERILKKRYTLFKCIIQCHAKPHPTLTGSIDFLKCRSGLVLSILCTPVGASNGLFLFNPEMKSYLYLYHLANIK